MPLVFYLFTRGRGRPNRLSHRRRRGARGVGSRPQRAPVKLMKYENETEIRMKKAAYDLAAAKIAAAEKKTATDKIAMMELQWRI